MGGKKKMQVKNMESSKGNKIANQFIIITDNGMQYFQSYNSIIVKFEPSFNSDIKAKVILDKTYWNYSVTTSKYRNKFLDETTQETKAKIKSGEYELEDLNCGSSRSPFIKPLPVHNNN